MGFAYQLLQVFLCAEPRVHFQEILYPVPVIAAVVLLPVLEYRAQPDGCAAKVLYVVQLPDDAFEVTSLKYPSLLPVTSFCCGVRIVGRDTVLAVVEPVNQQEINELVPPVAG
jgi:hypothetical protein